MPATARCQLQPRLCPVVAGIGDPGESPRPASPMPATARCQLQPRLCPVVAGIGDPGESPRPASPMPATARCQLQPRLCPVVAGIGDPGESPRGRLIPRPANPPPAGIPDAGYSVSNSISPCHGHSPELVTSPARTGFSFT